MTYASIFRRLVAFSVDCLLILGIYMFLGLILGISSLFQPLMQLPMVGFWWYGGMFFVAWLYFAGCESSPWQATVGKRMLHLKVVSMKGKRLGFWRATLRYFSKILSRLILMIGFLMIAFTKKKQALHDKIARSLVIVI